MGQNKGKFLSLVGGVEARSCKRQGGIVFACLLFSLIENRKDWGKDVFSIFILLIVISFSY
jgi:hypothetical protein